MELGNLSSVQLRKIISIKEEIEKLEGELDVIAGSDGTLAQSTMPGKRTISAAARARIAAAQRARWAKSKGGDAKTAKKKTKRTMSPAGRAKIAAAARARWVKVKAAGKNRL